MAYNERDPCHHHGGYDPVVRVPERDHNKLENRDESNQHPIKAISGLRKELNGMNKEITNKISTGDTLTNEDIDNILSK